MILMMIAAMENEDDKTFMLSLYNEYYGLVRKNIFSITQDYKDIEDLINDTFIRLIGKLPLIRTLDCCKAVAYVVCTSRSIAINFIKHRDVENKHAFFNGDADLFEDLPDPEGTIENRLYEREEIESLCSAILKLPEKQKNLLYFKYILQMNDEEIAKNFGIAPDSVRQYLTRARRDAKRLMEKEMSAHAK